MISEHGSEFLYSCLNISVFRMHIYEQLIGFDIRRDRARSHVSFISEDRIPDIVVMRNLNLIKQDHVFKLR